MSESAGMLLSIILGVVLGIGLFVALPVAVSNLLIGPYEANNAIAWNLVEAIVRIVLLVAYVAAIGLMPDMVECSAITEQNISLSTALNMDCRLRLIMRRVFLVFTCGAEQRFW